MPGLLIEGLALAFEEYADGTFNEHV